MAVLFVQGGQCSGKIGGRTITQYPCVEAYRLIQDRYDGRYPFDHFPVLAVLQ